MVQAPKGRKMPSIRRATGARPKGHHVLRLGLSNPAQPKGHIKPSSRAQALLVSECRPNYAPLLTEQQLQIKT